MSEPVRCNIDLPAGPIIRNRLVCLSGWIAGRPDDLAQVIFLINGSVLNQVGFTDRPDVPVEPGEAGRGWTCWIDVQDHVSERNPSVVLEIRHGRRLAGSGFFRYRPEGKPKTSPLSFFIHMPKTAGTAVRLQFERHQHVLHLVKIYHSEGMPSAQFLALADAAKEDVDIAYGHFNFGLHLNLRREFEYLTIIRRPESALVSNFSFRKDVVFDPKLAHVKNPQDIRFDPQLSLSFDNPFCRAFSASCAVDAWVSQDDYDLAIDNIDKFFEFVGLTERLEDSLRKFSRHYGVNLHDGLATANISPLLPQISQPDWRNIVGNMYDMLRYDLRLYEYVRRKFW